MSKNHPKEFKSSEFRKDRSHHVFDLRRGRSERRYGQRAADCLAANDHDSRIFYKLRFNATWLKTRSWIGAVTVGAQEAKPARGSHHRKPPKPSGLALRQGRWRPILGVEKVRARRRGPGHQNAILARRARHREMFPQDEVWSRRPIFEELA